MLTCERCSCKEKEAPRGSTLARKENVAAETALGARVRKRTLGFFKAYAYGGNVLGDA